MKLIVDTASKYISHIALVATIGFFSTIWGILRPQFVMASDLQTVVQSMKRLEDKVADQGETIELLTMSIIEGRIDYFEDQIRSLDTQSKVRVLTPDEVYRLSRYKDDLQKEINKRDQYVNRR